MRRAPWWAAVVTQLALAGSARAATFVVENGDPAGVGFNDPTPAAPVGGNTETTRGTQALFAFQHAADLWGAELDSAIPIRVHAQFAALSCTSTTGVVGSATPHVYAKDGPGATPGVWYPVALANRLAGADLDPTQPDIDAKFNGAIGTAGCLATSAWYLGLDGQAGNGLDLVTIVLHELAHGLGMTTPADLTTGAWYQGFPDAFGALLFDERRGVKWTALDDAGRLSSATDYQQLSFAGPEVTAAAATTLSKGVATLTVGAPVGLSPAIALATFGPQLPTTAISATLTAVNDLVGPPGDACQPIAAITGKIAFVESGGCLDVDKVLAVQTGGAVAAILVDTLLTAPPSPVTGTDPGGLVTIPSVRITQRDASIIRAALGTTIPATLGFDLGRGKGTSLAGRVYLDATDPVQVGRSVTHWDPSTTPDLLMEPVVRVGHGLDLTVALLHDLGWTPFGGNSRDAGSGARDSGMGLDACSSAAGGGCGGAGPAGFGGNGKGGAGSGGTSTVGPDSGAAPPSLANASGAKDPSCGCRLGKNRDGRGDLPGQAPLLGGAFLLFLAILRRRKKGSIYTSKLL